MLNLLYKLFAKIGLSHFLSFTLSEGKVTILIYHNPQLETFEKHVLYLSKYYQFISLSDYLLCIEKRDMSSLPNRSIIFTFDDGHKGNYRLLPIFKKYKIEPTIYICTAIVGTQLPYWWETVPMYKTKEKLKYYYNKKRVEELEINYGYNSAKGIASINTNSALSLSEMKEMFQNVSFESHTHNHPIMSTLADDELDSELLLSYENIKSTINANVHSIAYPNGDYKVEHFNYLKQIGFKSARTTNPGRNDLKTNPFELKGIGISDDASIDKLKFQLTGLFGYILNIINGGNFLNGNKKIIKPLYGAKL